jgi:NTP pyrophosphatase (non-canonical NTP hydrolase)|tara:strand:+ start:4903 stop:5313 length:411 start_codon:yes stop_codon:yes gene_type:complete
MSNIDLNKYKEFVQGVTSTASNETVELCNRLEALENQSNVNMATLLTGAVGMSSEAGEFAELIKKCVFQGKEMTDDIKKHLASELGDVAWYWINSCRALGVDPNEVIGNNVEKLKARYPGGEFNAFSSENRAEGDI